MMIKKVRHLCITAIFFFSYQMPHAFAAPAISTKTPLNENDTLVEGSTSVFPLLLQTFFALLFIIGLIYVLFRFLNKRQQQFFGKTVVRTLGGCALGPQKSLQVVQIGSSIYIVGVGEDVHLIRHVENKSEVEELLQSLDAHLQNGATFQIPSLVSRFMRKRNQDTEQQTFQSMLQMKMKEVRHQREQLKEEILDDEEKGNKR